MTKLPVIEQIEETWLALDRGLDVTKMLNIWQRMIDAQARGWRVVAIGLRFAKPVPPPPQRSE